MPVIDAVSDDGGGVVGSTDTWSHTCSGTDRLLIVGVSWDGPTSTASTVTYNGVALTRISLVANSTYHCSQWRLIAPATGSHSIVVDFGGVDQTAIVAGATSYTAVDQTTPLGTAVTASGSGTSASVTVTGSAGQLVQDVVGALNAITVGGSQTQEWNQSVPGKIAGGGSRGTGVTSSWTFSSGNWVQSAVGVLPVLVTLAGSTTGAASTSGAMSVYVFVTLAGSTSGVASTAGAMRTYTYLAGFTSGVGSTSGSMLVASAPIAGDPTYVTGTDGRCYALGSDGVSTVTGTDGSTTVTGDSGATYVVEV